MHRPWATRVGRPARKARAAEAALLGLAALALLAPQAAPAASSGRPVFAAGSVGSVRPLSPQQRQERRFLQEAAAHLHLVNAASELALARSQNAAVRELARDLVRHSKAAHPGLLRLLHARDMAMPMQGGAEAKLLRQLGKASGTRFDRMFIEEVAVRMQSGKLRHYERMAAAAQDPALKAWVEQHLPALRFQLAMAERALPGQRRAQTGARPAM